MCSHLHNLERCQIFIRLLVHNAYRIGGSCTDMSPSQSYRYWERATVVRRTVAEARIKCNTAQLPSPSLSPSFTTKTITLNSLGKLFGVCNCRACDDAFASLVIFFSFSFFHQKNGFSVYASVCVSEYARLFTSIEVFMFHFQCIQIAAQISFWEYMYNILQPPWIEMHEQIRSQGGLRWHVHAPMRANEKYRIHTNTPHTVQLNTMCLNW